MQDAIKQAEKNHQLILDKAFEVCEMRDLPPNCGICGQPAPHEHHFNKGLMDGKKIKSKVWKSALEKKVLGEK